MFAHRNNPIRVTLRILFFADKPQNLPSSIHLVVYAAVALMVASTWLGFSQPVSTNFQFAVLHVGIFGLAVWTILRLAGRVNRWRQTITALYGTSFFIRCLAYVPLLISMNHIQSSGSILSLAVVAIPFGIWSLCVSAFIFREAMEISMTRCFFIALGCNLFVVFIVLQLFSFLFGSAPIPEVPS